jgi:cation diffusion facilitator family transporter
MEDSINPEKTREKVIYKVTIVGAIVNIVLILFKFAAGILGRSSAMIADAFHSLSDLITDVVIIAFVKISHKPKDKDHNYGHGKFETLATLIIGIVLLVVGVGIAWSGITDIVGVIQGKTLETPGMIALIAAALSIVSKEILYRYTAAYGRKLNSDLVIANAWHHRSDALSSIATLIGIGGAILLGSKWVILDPLAALFVSFFILKIAFDLMKPCLDELLEKSLPEDVENEILSIVNSFEDVNEPHNLRTRKIGNYYAIEFHVRMDGKTSLQDSHTLVSKIEVKLKERYGENTHIIIHVEPNRE